MEEEEDCFGEYEEDNKDCQDCDEIEECKTETRNRPNKIGRKAKVFQSKKPEEKNQSIVIGLITAIIQLIKDRPIRVMFVILVALALFYPDATEKYTKEIVSDECPPSYELYFDYCVGSVDNVVYYKTPKSSVTLHYPGGIKVEELEVKNTKQKMIYFYHNLSVNIVINNLLPLGYGTYDEFLNSEVIPNIKSLNSSQEVGIDLEGKKYNYVYNIQDIKGNGFYYGEEGWLAEFESYYTENPDQVFFTKYYLFRLDEPYAMQLIVTGPKEDFDKRYAEALPYLNQLEIEVEN
jgi:hypothetical protein